MGSSCVDAIPLAVGAVTAGNIDVAGKRFHYRVTLSSNVTYLVTTVANPNDTAGALDTTLSIFSDSGSTLLSSVDDAFPRSGSDAQLFFRPAQSGAVCIRVEDFATWEGEVPTLRTPNRFTLEVNAGAGSFVGDSEPNDTGAGQLLPAGGAAWIGGALSTTNDVDIFSFSVSGGMSLLNVELPPNGDPLGPGLISYGSTLPRLNLAVQTTSGTTLAALGPASPVSASAPGLSVPVAPGAYRVLIGRPAGSTLGVNDFYGTIVSSSVDQSAELESLSTPSNNSKTAAESLSMMTSPTDPKVRSATWRGYLPAGDAVDYFKFTTSTTGNTLGLNCLAAREGSGLSGFTVSVYGPSATAIRAETESLTADIFWANAPQASGALLPLPTASTYYVALSNSSTAPGNTGRYYRCSIEVVRP